MPTKAQLVDLADRTLYTFLATLGAVFVPGTPLTQVHWSSALDVAGTAALIALMAQAKTLVGGLMNHFTQPPAAPAATRDAAGRHEAAAITTPEV